MRTTPQYGALLKHQPRAGITLIQTHQSRRLAAHLHDLIIIAYQRSTNRRGNSLSLEQLEYASAVESAGKYSMRLNVLVRDHDLDVTIPLTVSFTVDSEDIQC